MTDGIYIYVKIHNPTPPPKSQNPDPDKLVTLDLESYWADFNETYIWFRVCLEVFRSILDFVNCALKNFGLPLNILFVRNFKKFWWGVWHHKNLFFGVILKGFLNDFLENFVLFIRSPPYDLISVSPLVQTSLRPYLVIFYDFSIFASAY